MTFFRDIVQFYSDRSFDLPTVRELKTSPFYLIKTIVALSDNSEHPIPEFMECVRVIRAADFLGGDQALCTLSDRLCCSLEFLANTTSLSRLRVYVRNRYRMTVSYSRKRWTEQSMYKVFPSVTPNDLIVKSTCCGNEIHQSCYIDKRSCQMCAKELACLPRVFCGNQLYVKGTFYNIYETNRKSRLVRHSLS